jgi:hypothetical protein
MLMHCKENKEAMGICACIAICMGALSGAALANVVVTCGTMSASLAPTVSPGTAAAGLLPEAPPQADNKALSIAKLSTAPHARQPHCCGMGGDEPLRFETINLDMRDLHSKKSNPERTAIQWIQFRKIALGGPLHSSRKQRGCIVVRRPAHWSASMCADTLIECIQKRNITPDMQRGDVCKQWISGLTTNATQR